MDEPKRRVCFSCALANELRSPDNFDPLAFDYSELKANAPGAVQKVRLGMILNGVDIMGWPGGNIAAVHTDEDRAKTVDAFQATIKLMKDEGDL